MVLSLANVFPLFYAPLFISEYVFAVFIVLSRANVFTLFLCYFCRANVFALFMVLSRANMFTLFYVIFLERMCLHCVYAVYGTFTSEYVSAVYVIFLERMCLRCLWYFHERICLLCYFFSRGCVYAGLCVAFC